MNWKVLFWLIFFFPVGIFMLLKGKKKTTDNAPKNSETVNTRPDKKEIKKRRKEIKNRVKSSPPDESQVQTKSDKELIELFKKYTDLQKQTDKYYNVLKFRRDAGTFSRGCWKTQYGRVDLENSPKYGFLGEILKSDPLVRNLGKGEKTINPFGHVPDFKIEFKKLKESLEVGMLDDPVYTGLFSPISLDILTSKHSKELDELLQSETKAKYEYIVRLVNSKEFPNIDSSSFDKILRRFPDIDTLKNASISKISEIEGISRATATTIRESVEDAYYGK